MLFKAPPALCRAAASLMALATFSTAHAEDTSMDRTVTVSATGSVSAEPDMARISSGIVSEAATARDALSKNSAAMAKLVAGLKSAGIDAKDIQTSSFNVQPRYTNPQRGEAPTIDGYQVHNMVEIRARDLGRLGEILDNLVGLGANQMHGLSFEVSKAETLKDEARKDAVANALRRAQLFAAASGAEVGEVISIAEDVAFAGPRPVAYARAAMAESVPIEKGTETLEARVTVTWRLK